MGHVRHIEELASEVKGEVGFRGLLLGIAEEGLDSDAVSGLLSIGGLGVLGVIGVLGILGRAGLGLWSAAVGAGLQGPDERANGKEQGDM